VVWPHVTKNSIHHGFRHAGEPPPSTFLMSAKGPKRLQSPPQKVTIPAPDKFGPLIRAARRSPSLEVLCDILDLPPSKVKALIVDAQAAGHAIRTGAASIGLGHEPSTEVIDTGVPATVGERFRLGVVSDLHLGSKYCLRYQLKDCVARIYRAGARDILIPGDLLDGCYPHGQFELRYSGIEDQTADLFRSLPQFDGLRYHAVTGNHDETFTKPTGLNVGRYIEGYFRDHGRDDIRFYGDRAATLRIGGTTVRMLHPMGSCSYAVSYRLAKFAESFDSAEKPGILLVGHWHRSCYLYTRGIHIMACPTFQGPGSAFGKSLGLGPQAIGGLLLSWRLTEHKTLREFNLRPISYFKAERAKEVA
jgi:predicted phosphodiesterase